MDALQGWALGMTCWRGEQGMLGTGDVLCGKNRAGN